ncbi:MAG: DUF1553 domain-containing protein [Candidatus Solibacter usitatus]|nr:DUF1553 domain-containing protein [Candidatus Solibacter usitatus]
MKEQIAGDEFFPEDVTANTATGFYCVGPHRDLFPDQADINRVETLTDYTDTVGSVFLGLTVGCARCHDHKFDPIPQKDYYRLQAVFAPLVKTKVALNRLSSLGWDVDENIREIRLREIGEEIGALQKRCRAKLYDDKMARLSAEVRAAIRASDNNKTPRQRELASEYAAAVRVSDDEVRACFTADEAAQMRRVEKSLAAMFANYRAKPFACGATDAGDFAPKTFVPARGLRAAEPVEPGFLSALGGGGIDERSFERKATGPIPLFPTTGRRHALGAWLTRPDHPLTARVFVNRVWQYHFGRGLVHTASDYGRRGASPSHPELLNWLAAEFVSQGWSVKKLHREILLSAAYRRAAGTTKESKDRDPENVYLARFTRRRLQAEELRDAILAVTGNLNLKMGGKPVVPPLGKEELFGLIGPPDKAWIVTYDRGEYTRRSIYMMQKRTFRMPMLEAFDAPEPMLTCPRRDASTTAPQSLTLLNGSFLREHAQALADQLAQTSNPVDEAWRKILGRAPAPEENRDAAALLSAQEKNLGSRPKAIAELVRALLNTNEFLYVD